MCYSFMLLTNASTWMGMLPSVYRKLVERAFFINVIAAPGIWLGSDAFEKLFRLSPRSYYLFSMKAFMVLWGLMLFHMVIHSVTFCREWLPKIEDSQVSNKRDLRTLSVNVWFLTGAFAGFFAGNVIFSIPVLLFTGRLFGPW